jgi:chromosome partitioning protein
VADTATLEHRLRMTHTTICMVNQKGGCGKSPICFHVSGYFAASGLSVLLVDADPQGSLSQGFLGPSVVEALGADVTLAAIFQGKLLFGCDKSLPRSTQFEGISMIPANHHLAGLIVPAPEHKGMRHYALHSFLQEMRGFDVVLIDCPPTSTF